MSSHHSLHTTRISSGLAPQREIMPKNGKSKHELVEHTDTHARSVQGCDKPGGFRGRV
jgi:hypothetical protein